MFVEHRMRAFEGTSHANPDDTLWYGRSEMKRDLTEIEAVAEEARAKRGSPLAKVSKPSKGRN